jgi:hypothetical protein
VNEKSRLRQIFSRALKTHPSPVQNIVLRSTYLAKWRTYPSYAVAVPN